MGIWHFFEFQNQIAMINRIQIREILAWTVLVLAILIFGFSVSFAQSKSVEVINKNGKDNIKVEQIETRFTYSYQ